MNIQMVGCKYQSGASVILKQNATTRVDDVDKEAFVGFVACGSPHYTLETFLDEIIKC